MKKIVCLLLLMLLVTGCTVSIKFDKKDLFGNSMEEKKKLDDEELVDYIEDVANKIDSTKSKEVLKNTFVTLTDFIFYDGEIRGKKFSELKDDAREKILDIYEKMDSKIEEKYPNYKENIKFKSKEKYGDIKEKIKEYREEFKEEHPDIYEEYEESKKNISDVYEEYKPYIENGKEKVKEKYNEAKEKVKEWYEENKD